MGNVDEIEQTEVFVNRSQFRKKECILGVSISWLNRSFCCQLQWDGGLGQYWSSNLLCSSQSPKEEPGFARD